MKTLLLRRVAVTVVYGSILVIAVACNSGPAPAPTLPEGTPGFYIQTNEVDYVHFVVGPVPDVEVRATRTQALPGASGSVIATTVTTDGAGLGTVIDGQTPAMWNFQWVYGPGFTSVCNGQTGPPIQLNVGGTVYPTCYIYAAGGSALVEGSGAFALSPNPIQNWSPPSSATITGTGFDPTYGMPLVQYYGSDGTLVAQENATSVSSDGTTIQIPGFNTSALAPGEYVGFISNAASGGTYSYLGTAAVNVIAPTVTVMGAEQSWITDEDCIQHGYGCPPYYGYDSGQVGLTVNGVTAWAYYGSSDDDNSVASNLAATINGMSSFPVTATVSGATLTLVGKQTNAGTSYSVSGTVQDYYSYPYVNGPSFWLDPSSLNFTYGP